MQNIFLKLRLALKLSVPELANILSVTSGAVCNYENDRRTPAVDVAYKMLALAKLINFDCTLENLYPRTRLFLKDWIVPVGWQTEINRRRKKS